MQAVLDLVSRPDDPILDVDQPSLAVPRLPGGLGNPLHLEGVPDGRRRGLSRPDQHRLRAPRQLGLGVADVRWTSRPRAFLTDDVFPVPSDTPAGALLESDFEEMFVTPTYSLALLDSVADEPRNRERDAKRRS